MPKYDWSQLNQVGDHTIVEGVEARQVSVLARINVEKRLGEGTVVSCKTIPTGTFVVVCYIPPPRPKPSNRVTSHFFDEDEDEDAEILTLSDTQVHQEDDDQ